MRILLTNDDGIFSSGLKALLTHFQHNHTVMVVAPDRERSAVGHGITLHEPLRAMRVRLNKNHDGFAVNGTPADCIKLGIMELMAERPDIVISGINPGANIGINAHYSGTVAAAREAALYRLKAIAVSVDGTDTAAYAEIVDFVERFAKQLIQTDTAPGTFLNMNIPISRFTQIKGVRITRQGHFSVIDGFEKRVDPRNRTYYWQKVTGALDGMDTDMDGFALKENYISITPMTCDMTDYRAMTEMMQSEILTCRKQECV
ncbi:MAG: 5'/3'-nucleotidase SurE [Desulfatirhabdiaceae bacterium]